MLRYVTILLFLTVFFNAGAQTLGGNTVFNFLRLPGTARQSALGGVNVSDQANEIGLSFGNPALLRSSMHSQLDAAFNGLYDGIKGYQLLIGYHHQPLNTNFSFGLNYLDYGRIMQTDASGNLLGQSRPSDWVMQVSASRTYLEHWNYGLTIKFINSNYGIYRSNGIAADVGVLYRDTTRAISVSIVAKNMGSQLKAYMGTELGDLPFDLQLGFSKRFINSPFGFSVTAHHLHQFDISYNDIAFNEQNGFAGEDSKGLTLDRLFRHIVVAGNIFLGEFVEIDAGYNYLRRKELSIGNSGNGLTGFSLGASLRLPKLSISYARSHYQNNTAYNQFGLMMTLNKYVGLGKFGQRIGW